MKPPSVLQLVTQRDIGLIKLRKPDIPTWHSAPPSRTPPAWRAGTLAFNSRWLSVIAKPSGSFSNVIVQIVSRLSAVSPASPNCAESAIVKQPACAAASSSSGLVPLPVRKSRPKRIGRAREHSAGRRDVSLPCLQITAPLSIRCTFHDIRLLNWIGGPATGPTPSLDAARVSWETRDLIRGQPPD